MGRTGHKISSVILTVKGMINLRGYYKEDRCIWLISWP